MNNCQNLLRDLLKTTLKHLESQSTNVENKGEIYSINIDVDTKNNAIQIVTAWPDNPPSEVIGVMAGLLVTLQNGGLRELLNQSVLKCGENGGQIDVANAIIEFSKSKISSNGSAIIKPSQVFANIKDN